MEKSIFYWKPRKEKKASNPQHSSFKIAIEIGFRIDYTMPLRLLHRTCAVIAVTIAQRGKWKMKVLGSAAFYQKKKKERNIHIHSSQ